MDCIVALHLSNKNHGKKDITPMEDYSFFTRYELYRFFFCTLLFLYCPRITLSQ